MIDCTFDMFQDLLNDSKYFFTLRNNYKKSVCLPKSSEGKNYTKNVNTKYFWKSSWKKPS